MLQKGWKNDRYYYRGVKDTLMELAYSALVYIKWLTRCTGAASEFYCVLIWSFIARLKLLYGKPSMTKVGWVENHLSSLSDWCVRLRNHFARLENHYVRLENHCIGNWRNVRGLEESVVVFRFFEKLRYSNERSTKFESLCQNGSI